MLDAVTKFKDYFLTETLTRVVSKNLSDANYSEEYEVDNNVYLLKIKKVQGES